MRCESLTQWVDCSLRISGHVQTGRLSPGAPAPVEGTGGAPASRALPPTTPPSDAGAPACGCRSIPVQAAWAALWGLSMELLPLFSLHSHCTQGSCWEVPEMLWHIDGQITWRKVQVITTGHQTHQKVGNALDALFATSIARGRNFLDLSQYELCELIMHLCNPDSSKLCEDLNYITDSHLLECGHYPSPSVRRWPQVRAKKDF